ncbi:MAG: dual specificity protein phosphatase family protein, partial [Candidatus Methylomirabilis sp.]|nr:dual specificity protein phosphatase family protein [Deltaproteobacteria bacterium]
MTDADKGRLAGVAQRANFSWAVKGRLPGAEEETGLAVMAMPGRFNPVEDDLALLAALGVTALVNLSGGPADYPAAGLSVHDLPVVPMAAPSLDQMRAFCRIVDDRRAKGERVAVHCVEGIGRAGVMGAAYMIHAGGMTAADALALLRRTRRVGQTPAQERAVYA